MLQAQSKNRSSTQTRAHSARCREPDTTVQEVGGATCHTTRQPASRLARMWIADSPNMCLAPLFVIQILAHNIPLHMN